MVAGFVITPNPPRSTESVIRTFYLSCGSGADRKSPPDLFGPGCEFRPNPTHLDPSPPPTAPSSMTPLLGFLGEIN